MGLLTGATPLPWPDTRKHNELIKRHGIAQFLRIHERFQDLKKESFKWGDEVEYTLMKFDHESELAQLSLRQTEVLSAIQSNPDPQTDWRPEYGGYMIEGVPGQPFGESLYDLCRLEDNMKKRRQQLKKILAVHGETVVTITSFPRLGCPDFTSPSYRNTQEQNAQSRSIFFPDQAISDFHPKYYMFTRNVRERSGRKIPINTPIFKDEHTPSPFVEEFINDLNGECAAAAQPDHIHMDAAGFGVGCSCLQMTIQPRSMDEARYLYDQLAVLAPILMSLSAASPIYRGYLSDVDCRWDVLEQAHDDRTEEERGEKPLKRNKFVIPKSRYGSIGCFLSSAGGVYNDINLVYDKDIYDQLVNGGVDQLVAQHIANIFIRDSISLCKESLQPRDENDLSQFENIHSSVWQSVRLKVPCPSGDIGWRVEVRTPDVQMTDFENTAYVVFVVLLSRALLYYDIDLLVPLSLVDENVKEAQKRDSILTGKFYFSKSLEKSKAKKIGMENIYEECDQMSMNEIINGKEDEFFGLVPLINNFLDSGTVEIDEETRNGIDCYLKIITNRASGELMTTARWMREFVQTHPEYKRDSVVTDTINYDLMVACDKISRGEIHSDELLGFKYENMH